MTKLDIISDPICPWCYIGKTNLDKALEKYSGHGLLIEWHPFQLNPSMPARGMDRREYLEGKFGGKQDAVRVYGKIAKTAEDAGIEINFSDIKRTPNTVDAHRLLHWAKLEGRQNAVVARVFKAYFRDGKDISDQSVLVAIAADAGLDAQMIRILLEGDANRQDVLERDVQAREKGVSGVPCFVIDNHYVVQGAQPAQLWEKVIDELNGAPGHITNNPLGPVAK